MTGPCVTSCGRILKVCRRPAEPLKLCFTSGRFQVVGLDPVKEDLEQGGGCSRASDRVQRVSGSADLWSLPRHHWLGGQPPRRRLLVWE